MIKLTKHSPQHFSREFYERKALYVERYRSPYFWEARYHQKRMENVFQTMRSHIPNGIFLDAGCGTGEYLTMASSLGFKMIGIDVSLNYLRRAKARCAAAYLIQVDINALPFRNHQIDLTLCSEVLEHLPRVTNALSELLRVTRGALIITTPNYGLLRRTVVKVSGSYLKKLDENEGHINVLSVNWLCEKLNGNGWKVTLAKTIHVTPPIVGKILPIPRIASFLFSIVEHALNVFLPKMGNISLIVCEKSRN